MRESLKTTLAYLRVLAELKVARCRRRCRQCASRLGKRSPENAAPVRDGEGETRKPRKVLRAPGSGLIPDVAPDMSRSDAATSALGAEAHGKVQ